MHAYTNKGNTVHGLRHGDSDLNHKRVVSSSQGSCVSVMSIHAGFFPASSE